MRRNIIEQYPSVKDLEVALKEELGRVDAQEFLRDSAKLFIHSGDAGKVADTGKHILYGLNNLINLKKDLAGRSRSEKATAFVVESESSLDELEGDLKNLKESGEVFDEDSNLQITNTQRDEHSVDVQVSYVHRKAANRSLMDTENRRTFFDIHETKENDNIYKVTQNFIYSDEFDAAKKLFNHWDRQRKIKGEPGVSRADIRIEAITPLEKRVEFFDDFLTYNPNNWDTRNVRHLGVRQSGDQDDDAVEEIGEETTEGELEEQIDKHLNNITELALTGKSLRDNPIVEKCLENDFYFDTTRIYCENLEKARGVVVELKFKRRGRNAFDLSLTKEYKLVDGGQEREPFSIPFRQKTRDEFRDAVVDLFGKYKDMPDLVNERGDSYSLTNLPGVGPKISENLKDAGYDSVSEILDAGEEELAEVDGVGPSTAERILDVKP